MRAPSSARPTSSCSPLPRLWKARPIGRKFWHSAAVDGRVRAHRSAKDEGMGRKVALGSASLAVLLTVSGVTAGETRRSFRPERVAFEVEIGERRIVDRIASVFVLPGQRVPIEALDASAVDRFQPSASSGVFRREHAGLWSWTAPVRSGLYHLSIFDFDSGEK